jgi:hypothetical protein
MCKRGKEREREKSKRHSAIKIAAQNIHILHLIFSYQRNKIIEGNCYIFFSFVFKLFMNIT